MMTISLPPDLESRVADEALRRGTTPELLALAILQQQFPTAPSAPVSGSLLDFTAPYAGRISGTSELLSENCGQRFAAGLAENQERGQL